MSDKTYTPKNDTDVRAIMAELGLPEWTRGAAPWGKIIAAVNAREGVTLVTGEYVSDVRPVAGPVSVVTINAKINGEDTTTAVTSERVRDLSGAAVQGRISDAKLTAALAAIRGVPVDTISALSAVTMTMNAPAAAVYMDRTTTAPVVVASETAKPRAARKPVIKSEK